MRKGWSSRLPHVNNEAAPTTYLDKLEASSPPPNLRRTVCSDEDEYLCGLLSSVGGDWREIEHDLQGLVQWFRKDRPKRQTLHIGDSVYIQDCMKGLGFLTTLEALWLRDLATHERTSYQREPNMTTKMLQWASQTSFWLTFGSIEQPDGFLQVEPSTDEYGVHLFITELIAVRPGSGVGRCLLDSLKTLIGKYSSIAINVTSTKLCVHASNWRAISFYLREGFLVLPQRGRNLITDIYMIRV